MRERTATWILWATALVTVPVPFFMIERGLVPVARLCLFALITSIAVVVDGDYAARWIAFLFVFQGALYAWLLRIVTRRVARRLVRLSSAAVQRTMVVLLVATMLAVALAEDVYVTPLSGTGERGNLWNLFD
jgi:predicted Co/Zn/Cd cation transporter (cation efflux family)